jgi:nascent polypeptide-associated complex subunit alpha
MFGGGGLDPRKMEQMMKQMGIDTEEIEATRVVITTPDGDLVFSEADVTKIEAQGQETYQIVGSPDLEEDTDAAGAVEAAEPAEAEIPDADIEIVATRAGVGKDEAREALEATDGDLAAAIARLE